MTEEMLAIAVAAQTLFYAQMLRRTCTQSRGMAPRVRQLAFRQAVALG